MLMPASIGRTMAVHSVGMVVGRIGLRVARINQDTGGLSPLFAINWIGAHLGLG